MAYGHATRRERPRMHAGCSGFGFLIPAAASTLPIGSKYVLPCSFTSDLKKPIAEHLAFALVDAGRQVLVDVVAEQVAVQERPAAVRLHEQLDGGVLLRFAAEDLGDDALHLAAVALVDQRRAPRHQRVAAHDQPRQLAEPPPHQLALDDRLAVGSPELAQGIMLAIITRITPAALAHSATRPRFRPW